MTSLTLQNAGKNHPVRYYFLYQFGPIDNQKSINIAFLWQKYCLHLNYWAHCKPNTKSELIPLNKSFQIKITSEFLLRLFS